MSEVLGANARPAEMHTTDQVLTRQTLTHPHGTAPADVQQLLALPEKVRFEGVTLQAARRPLE
jgi:hypothetical protein